MIDRTTRLRWRRRFRKSKRQVEDAGLQAEKNLERLLIKRLYRLWEVRRFVLSWFLLLSLLVGGVIVQTIGLSQYYQSIQPAAGGVLKEGVLGMFTNANPLYATGAADNAVGRLVFSGLLKFDERNKLIGDLAESWKLDSTEQIYTVKLRQNLKWHDGRPLTAADVVFTYKVIQNPDAKSPLRSSWQNVKVSQLDDLTVVFELPNSLSAFPYSMTNGIVPEHILKDIDKSRLRSIPFNTVSPVGSGPYKWQTIESASLEQGDREELVGLIANPDYHLGKPRINRIVIRTFRDEKRMVDSFLKREVQAMAGLSTVPDELKNNPEVLDFNIPMSGQVMVFFKLSNELLQDQAVRKALVYATSVPGVVADLGYPVALSDSPMLSSQVGYTKQLVQPKQNLPEAHRLLDESGWVMNKDTGLRSKGDVPLRFSLFSLSNSEYTAVAQKLQSQWRAVGVDLEVILQPDQELQSTIAFHNYDALLYGISIGPDPDVFAYWHSSQADPRSGGRLNFSEYKSSVADRALEAGRTRSDPALRTVKYRPFLEQWHKDVPAVALYQPSFLYIAHAPLFGFEAKTINAAADRFNNIEKWMVREEKNLKQ